MTPDEAKSHIEEIVEFADIGDHIDQPFRTYSSGMRARVQFANAMSVRPDILVIDEALSAGDASFILRAQKRVRELCQSGATILFVSHNVRQVRELCDRVLLFHKGRIVGDGPCNAMIDRYMKLIFEDERSKVSTLPELNRSPGVGAVLQPIRLCDIFLRDASGKRVRAMHTGDSVDLIIDYEADAALTDVGLFIGVIQAENDLFVAYLNSQSYISRAHSRVSQANLDLDTNGRITVKFQPIILLNNRYSFWLQFFQKDGSVVAEYRHVCPFFISRVDDSYNRDGPVCWLPAEFEFSDKDGE